MRPRKPSLVNGFVAPGAGPSAGVCGIFAVLCIGLIFAALANARASALILAVTGAGWRWQPVMWTAPKPLRWLTE